jgi:hypothetical protein
MRSPSEPVATPQPSPLSHLGVDAEGSANPHGCAGSTRHHSDPSAIGAEGSLSAQPCGKRATPHPSPPKGGYRHCGVTHPRATEADTMTNHDGHEHPEPCAAPSPPSKPVVTDAKQPAYEVPVQASRIGRSWSFTCPTCRRQHLVAPEAGEHEPRCMASALAAVGLTRADVRPLVIVAPRAAA